MKLAPKRETAQVEGGGPRETFCAACGGGGRLGGARRDIMRMCGAHRFISSACVVLYIIGLELRASASGLFVCMHSTWARGLLMILERRRQTNHESRLARPKPFCRHLLDGWIERRTGNVLPNLVHTDAPSVLFPVRRSIQPPIRL